MKITYERLIPYTVRAFCDCGGELVATGQSYWNGAGSESSHRCDKCGAATTLKNQQYPRTVYKPEGWVPPQ